MMKCCNVQHYLRLNESRLEICLHHKHECCLVARGDIIKEVCSRCQCIDRGQIADGGVTELTYLQGEESSLQSQDEVLMLEALLAGQVDQMV
jgi:hypothetical protein